MSKQFIDFGDTVLCDWCGEDFTDGAAAQEKGGVLFGSKAVCPRCVPRLLPDVVKYNEQEFLGEKCPEDMTFKDWCLQLRGGNNIMTIETL